MKKGEIYSGITERVSFGGKGLVRLETGDFCKIKNAVPGRRVSVLITKKRSGSLEGRVLEVLEKGVDETEPPCRHFGICGGCSYICLPYDKQLALKEKQVRELLEPVLSVQKTEYAWEPAKSSPVQSEYRNKMEFSFGDAYKDGPLELGLHKRGSFYDIESVTDCRLVDEDYRLILRSTLAYFRDRRVPYYHRFTHEGYLRHLLVRKTVSEGEIMVALVTTGEAGYDAVTEGYRDMLLGLSLKGQLVSILHTVNNSVADAVVNQGTRILYGRDYVTERLLGLKFRISEFSFFQTNSLGAQLLYETAREFIGDVGRDSEGRPDRIIYDLYSGTGTIAQMMAPVAKKVIGVEIVEEAVASAIENAELNGLENCEFIAGDVLKVLDDIVEKPDFIILDPPRDGLNPKALRKIIDYGVDRILYISCKPTSLARDLEMLIACGYEAERVVCVDQFPGTVHVETVCSLHRIEKKNM